jgi:hypothetical protein
MDVNAKIKHAGTSRGYMIHARAEISGFAGDLGLKEVGLRYLVFDN